MNNETYSTEGPECPHCGRQYTADGPHYFDEQNYTSEICDECDKPFSVEVHVTTSWTCAALTPNPKPAQPVQGE